MMDGVNADLYLAAYASELVCKDVTTELVNYWLDGGTSYSMECVYRRAIDGYARGCVACRLLLVSP